MRRWLPALTVLLALPPAHAQLSPEERRGSEIYMRGTSPSGREIVALLDNGRTPAPGALMPCANCHGPDGRGKPEGGVVPPNITWDQLTKPYGVRRSDGRTHPPYTERTLKRAFTMGRDSAGNELDPVMPRFQLSYEDAANLIAFLKRLGHLPEPGVSDTTIRIGVVLPPLDRVPSRSTLVRNVLGAYFERFNREGGVYGRAVELVFFDLPPVGAEQGPAFRAWLAREQVFALSGSDLTESPAALTSILKDTATPAICAFALDPDTRPPLNPYVFYLNAGLRGEVDQLINLAAKRHPAGARGILAVAPYDPALQLGKIAQTRLTEAGWNPATISADADACKSVASDPARPAAVFWFADGASITTLRECAVALDRAVEFFIPGSMAPPDLFELPTALDQRVFVTLPPSHAGEYVSASARLLTLALQRSGRTLTRPALLDALEGMYHVAVGHLEVSFGPNRRIGSYETMPSVLDLRARRAVPIGVSQR